jgi:hypothetical protein
MAIEAAQGFGKPFGARCRFTKRLARACEGSGACQGRALRAAERRPGRASALRVVLDRLRTPLTIAEGFCVRRSRHQNASAPKLRSVRRCGRVQTWGRGSSPLVGLPVVPQHVHLSRNLRNRDVVVRCGHRRAIAEHGGLSDRHSRAVSSRIIAECDRLRAAHVPNRRRIIDVRQPPLRVVSIRRVGLGKTRCRSNNYAE